MPVSPIDPAQGSRPVVGNQPASVVAQQQPPPSSGSGGRFFIKIPTEQLFSGLSQILFLASVVVIVGISIIFLGLPGLPKSVPGSQSNKVGPFAPPINVADVKFPSDFQRDIFLKNFQDAGKTTDSGQRYKLLQDDYTRLLGFYTGDHDPKTRKVLEQFSQYMINNYPDQAQKSIYTVPCFDSGCGKVNYPQEIQKIKADLTAASASAELKDSLNKNFEEAALSSDKNFQWSTYVNALSSVKSTYDLNKDQAVLAIYKHLADFITKNYPDYKIPPQIRM